MPVKPAAPHLKIGNLVEACRLGRLAGQRGSARRMPGWVAESPTLVMAFLEGFNIARQKEGRREGAR